jgi:hypothetical protein
MLRLLYRVQRDEGMTSICMYVLCVHCYQLTSLVSGRSMEFSSGIPVFDGLYLCSYFKQGRVCHYAISVKSKCKANLI